MISKRYFLPISTTSLAHHWGSGLIMPSALFTKANEKTQTISNALILTDKIFEFNEKCSLEVILIEEDLRQLTEFNKGTYILESCLPISRITGIFFRDEEQLKTTIWNINQGAAFVPDSLLKIYHQKEAEGNYQALPPESFEREIPVEMLEKVNRFNVILGGFSFMRLAYNGTYRHSENFFSTLGHFSPGINNCITWYRDNKGMSFSSRYIDLFTNKESEWSAWRQYIFRGIDANEAYELAKAQGLNPARSISGFKMETLDPNTMFYDIALLSTYGDNKPKSLDDLASFLSGSTVSETKLEEIALLFGLRTGYSKLRNKYKFKGRQLDVKFRFETQLDYEIVESIFQFLFYGKGIATNFAHLHSSVPKQTTSSGKIPEGAFQVLDVIAESKNSRTSIEKLEADLTDGFFERVAETIYKWGVPYDSDAQMLANAKKFLKTQFSNQLNDIVEQRSMARKRADAPNLASARSLTEKSNLRSDVRSIAHLSVTEKYGNYTWAELKKLAVSKKIKVPKTLKGTLKEFVALAESIESINTML